MKLQIPKVAVEEFARWSCNSKRAVRSGSQSFTSIFPGGNCAEAEIDYLILSIFKKFARGSVFRRLLPKKIV